MTPKSNFRALLPIGVFLVIFLGAGILFKDFYAIPSIVAFLIALVVAFLQNPKCPFEEKMKIAAKEIGNENIITMCLIFLAAGAFSGSVKAVGGVESTVNLGLSLIKPEFAVVGVFVIACFISISMGTSMGTIATLTPIAVGISEKSGISPALCVGAVMCGAMFGDNLSMISDTTIAAVKTQGCMMKDKFRENFFIVLPAAIITIVIFALLTRGGNYTVADNTDYDILKVIPYLIVLIGALSGINVFVVLLGGTVASLLTGVFTGSLSVNQIFIAPGEGITGMYDITVISIVVAAIVGLIKEYGGIQFILLKLRKFIKNKKGAEMGIGVLSFLVDMCTANNTVAIVIAGPIAKEISDNYGISAKRTASLLDIFTSVGQGLIPYGAQMLLAASLSTLTPFEILPNMYYPVLMSVSAILFIIFGKSKKKA